MNAARLFSLCRRPLAAVVFALGLGILLVAPAMAAEPADAIAQFGTLPVRFNGRVATMDSAARALLMRISAREVFFDDEGREVSAVEWLLDELSSAGEPTGAKLLLIQNADVLKLTNLEARPTDGPLHYRYTYEELEPSFDVLSKTAQKANGKDPDFEQAVHELFEVLRAYLELRAMLATPAGQSVEQLRDAIERLSSFESAILPEIVPRANAQEGWMFWGRAVVEDAVEEAANGAGRTSNPAFVQLQKIFAARKARDDIQFADAVATYADWLRLAPLASGALTYTVPENWQELGVNLTNFDSFFDDTLASGAPVAVFGCNSADGSCIPQVIYFPTATASVERIFNHWRVQCGLAPLPDEELRRTLTPIRSGTNEGFSIDMTEAENLGRSPPRRILATIFRRDNDTLVLQATGSPKAVETERHKYAAFLKSVTWGTPEELRAWFPLAAGDPRIAADDYSVVVATVKKGADVWFFRVGGRGAMAEASRAAMFRFIETFDAAPFLAGGDPRSWTPPEGWLRSAPADEPVAFEIAEGDDKYRYLNAVPLTGYTPACELPLFNEWRTAVNLAAWSAAEAAKEVKTAKAGGAEVRFVEFIGPPDAPAKP